MNHRLRGLGLARLLTSALILTSGLAEAATRGTRDAATRTLRDDTGEAVTVKTSECRIVSLAPGTTAMLYAAGAGHCLIGTIAHSNEPEEATRLRVVGDAETLDFEQLLALRPSAVVVAVDVVQRVRIDRIRSLGIPVYQVHVTKLAGMPESLRRLGRLANTSADAERAAGALDADLAKLRDQYRDRKPVRVLYQIWDKPIYTIGGRHVINDALQLCGARNLFDDLATAAPAITREAALARDPELILASAPPESARAWLDEWRRFTTLSAVRRQQLIAYSDERIDRMGPSVIAATAQLCEVIDQAREGRNPLSPRTSNSPAGRPK
jgi:iron complex transport system substrate-binding protein